MTRAFLAFRIAVAALLVVALGDWPYAYFTVLRVLTTVAAIEVCVVARSQAKYSWLLPFAAISILWNPLFPVRFGRDAWILLDLLAAVLFAASVTQVRATCTSANA